MKNDKKEDMRLVVQRRTFELLMAALAFVTGLAWNDAIQGFFQWVFGAANTLLAKFIYALIMTLIIVVMSMWLARLSGRVEERLQHGKHEHHS